MIGINGTQPNTQNQLFSQTAAEESIKKQKIVHDVYMYITGRTQNILLKYKGIFSNCFYHVFTHYCKNKLYVRNGLRLGTVGKVLPS